MDPSLLAAVLARPADDGPRLVLADWLTERGDPRGELISVQCLLERRLGSGHRETLRARARELLAIHREEWSRPAAAVADHWEFRRGFIESITSRNEHSIGGAPFQALMAAEPVERLKISAATPTTAANVAAGPWLGRITSLHLRGARLGDEGVYQLLRAPRLALQSLNLGDSDVTAGGASALAAAPSLRALRSLGLSGNPIGDGGAAALASSSQLVALEKLYLARAEIGDRGAVALAASEAMAHLTRLCLGGNEAIGGEGVAALAASPYLGRLHHLELDGTRPGDEGAGALAQLGALRSLTRLDLEHCHDISMPQRRALSARWGQRLTL